MKQMPILTGFLALVVLVVLAALPNTLSSDAQIGVRHSRIATDLGLYDFRTSRTNPTFIPTTAVSIQAVGLPTQGFSSSDRAEMINAAAMKDYQRRFEIHLKTPRTVPVPTLYPSQIERMLGELK